jgi:hypothetical protein
MAEEDSEEVILEMNKRINNLNYTFRVDAPLKNYIHSKTNSVREIYTLAQLLTILKNIIGDEGLYDPRNTYIILCDTAMEAAFDLPGMHVTEIREFVFRQLELLPEEYQNPVLVSASVSEILPQETVSEPTTSTVGAQSTVGSEVQIIDQTVRRISNKIYSNTNARFEMKPDFRDVLSLVPGFEHHRTLFSYDEITALLSTYLLSRKESIFDSRHIKLALVKNDPLGKAFDVDCFHRCQVTSMLRKQIIYVGNVSSEVSSSTPSTRKVKFG